MKINNGFNILPWYDSLEKQNCKKWYAYGQAWPLLCPQGSILPFQFISDTAITISSNIYAISVETGQTIDLGVKPTVTEISRADITYYIVKLVSTSIVNLPIGRYNLRMNTSEGFLYSEELVVINNANECIKVEYWNEDTLKFTSGEINFTDDFHFIFYINSTIGKPEYEFEEELTKRLGYKFIESQTSNKVYKFSFVAPEYICDAMRLIRMCDYIKLATKFDSYNALSFAYEPKWQEQGDLAAVDVEFDTDCIIQKLESFNRRAKESFYNALLADIDEPVLFSTDTVAQYYTEYTASGTISGKLIRQLTAISEDELVSSLSSIVLPVDNQSDNSQVAKKAFLSDIVNKLIPKVNLSDYLLKSIWDKVFEIRTDKQGKEYIFGKLPVVTQYGITMYADGGDIDLPSLYTGLPIDGKTLIRDEKGVLMVNPDIELGGGVSNFWDLSGIPSWITNSKPKYSYSEIEGTPDLSVYAQVDTLKAYVTLTTSQNINGEKNFIGGLKVNGSPIIYDSVNKCWKLQGNLVLTGGITMYADDGTLNLPSIYDGLPIDGTTIYWDTDAAGNRVLKAVGGGGTADSVAWNNITGKPSWIGSSKPTYSYSEIQGTPDLSVYALKTQIPSLSGYATESWVTKQNYATKATTLSGYGITDAYTKTNVDDLLKSYVTLGGTQTITGEKNFTGGLKVNGSPIYYDTEKKYWKLEGDLLVTGGVTMYGSDSSFAPSTIMDAIAVDGTTISKDGGVLKVIGGTGGGGLDITALQNYLTQNSYLNITSGDNRYLPLSGGTITGSLEIKCGADNKIVINNTDGEGYSRIVFQENGSYIGQLLSTKDGNIHWGASKIWHSGNDGSGSGLDADLLDGKHDGELTAIKLHSGGGSIIDANNFTYRDYALRFYSGIPDTSTNLPTTSGYQNGLLVFPIHSNGNTAQLYVSVGKNPYFRSHHTYKWNELAYKTDNVASASKLLSGVGNVDGHLYMYNQTAIYMNDTSGTPRKVMSINGNNLLLIGEQPTNYTTVIDGESIHLRTKDFVYGLYVNSLGDVGIGTTAPEYKFHVAGSGYFSSYLSIGTASTASLSMNRTSANYITTPTGGYMVFCMGGNSIAVGSSSLALYQHNVAMAMSGGNVGIGTVSPSYKLDVNGEARFGSLTPADGLNIIPFAVVNSSYAKTGWCASFGTEKGGVLLGYNDTKSIAYIGASKSANISMCPDGGNIGVGTSTPTTSLDIKGKSMEVGESVYGSGGVGSEIYMSTHREGSTLCARGMRMYVSGGATGIFQSFSIDAKNYGTLSNIMSINSSGNLLVTGGVTMYSDQRKKTILNHVELSLKQIANAPLIEHYYNSDESKTTHVGSIAQYWAAMNDWFCKLDSEGYYTMEIQNAALASAISIARELDRYETKTGKDIKKLKKRICELEEEIERLKAS